jgi:hypothetical protein
MVREGELGRFLEICVGSGFSLEVTWAGRGPAISDRPEARASTDTASHAWDSARRDVLIPPDILKVFSM